MAAHPHLPPGHPPGPQSRRMRVGRTVTRGCLGPFLVVWGLVAGGMLTLLGAVVLTVTEAAPVVLAPIGGAVLALGAVLLAVKVSRSGRSDGDLAAEVDRTELRRGGEVRARLERGAGDVELGLVCVAHVDTWRRGGADGDSSRVTDVVRLWSTWVAAAGVDVALRVPEDGACSYEGDAVSVAWSVRARRVGAERTSEPAPLWVAP